MSLPFNASGMFVHRRINSRLTKNPNFTEAGAGETMVQFVHEGIIIGPVFIHYYGIIIMFGAIAAAFIADREARRRGMNPDQVWDCLPWLLIGGIVGARIWHILTPPPSMVAQGITTMYYLTHPLDAIAVWKGGVGIPGAVMGGVLALYLYTRSNKSSFAEWVDIIAPGLAIAQAIGRWGNFVNQELYGAPTTLPWGIYIDPAHRLPGFENVSYYHPIFFYESLWSIANAIFLIWLGRRYAKKLIKGDIFLSYLIIYPVGRFLLEFLRLDSSQLAGLNANQTLMGAIAICATVALILRHRFATPQLEVEETAESDETEDVEAGDEAEISTNEEPSTASEDKTEDQAPK
jgi:phosphatidylglycerol---prolipoprotein diacylglyceryl transferase